MIGCIVKEVSERLTKDASKDLAEDLLERNCHTFYPFFSLFCLLFVSLFFSRGRRHVSVLFVFTYGFLRLLSVSV